MVPFQVGRYPYYLKQKYLGDRGDTSNENAETFSRDALNDDMNTVMLGHLSKENKFRGAG